MGDGDETCVRVALRIRPRNAREVIDNCQSCTTVTAGQPQVWIGGTHAFTYDSVFDTETDQGTIFDSVKYLVEGCIDGYNATILAYGQTGSGKTYTMGSGFDVENLHATQVTDSQGIIPRAVYYLFNLIEDRKRTAIENHEALPDFKIDAQFVELYNEEVYDLIGGEPKNFKKGSNGIKIHEDSSGSIYMVGVGTKAVTDADATMECLRTGALSRTTAATNMNDTSSRSHAIFTLHITQTRVGKGDDENDNRPELETLYGKFHFVDLAGSERLKRTGAVGDRAKEGISINCGLLALGNVISALGDKSKKASHVPYRVSKLTRLLQDSLGGNSRTLMIACVSPCDRDFIETLSTLKYANRAKNIKNKVTINQDKSSRMVSMLQQKIVNLEMQLHDLKQGRRAVTESGEEIETDTYHENVMLTKEVEALRLRVHGLQETVDRLTASNASLETEKVTACWASSDIDMGTIVKQYTLNIEELRAKLCESESTCEVLRKRNAGLATATSPRVAMSSRPGTACSVPTFHRDSESEKKLCEIAKQEIINEKQELEELKDHPEDYEDEDLDSRLATLTENISTKEKLLQNLEASEQRMIQVKAEYEKKLIASANKIKQTEDERDAVLAGHKTNNSASSKMRQVNHDYEVKLAELQKERNKLVEAQREHHRLNKQNINYEKMITKLKTEVESMKRIKVKLMNQMKEENLKWRESEARKVKEIATLRKDQRKKDIKIQTLESRDKMKEQVLKRKLEEVSALKKKQLMSKKVAGKVLKRFSPVKAKKRWSELKTNILKDVTTRSSVDSLEKEMLVHINNRTNIMAEIAALKDSVNGEESDIDDHLDTLTANLAYTEEQIADIQCSLLEAASSKDEAEAIDMENVINVLSKDECGYVLQKMYEHTVENLTAAGATTRRVHTLEEDKKKLMNETAILRELLLHLYSKNAADDPDLPPELAVHLQNLRAGRSLTFGADLPGPEPTVTLVHDRKQLNGGQQNGGGNDIQFQAPYPVEKPMSKKARRLTSTPQELLGAVQNSQMDGAGESSTFARPWQPGVGGNFIRTSSARYASRRRDTYSVLPEASRLNGNAEANGKAKASRFSPPQTNAAASSAVTTSTLPTADFDFNTTFLVDPSQNVAGITPPGSPNAMKRSMRDENVFQRLTSTSNTEIPVNPGLIKPVINNKSSRSPFLSTHIAEGHSKSVLSIVATDLKLFTGAKDATVKVWDLEAGVELSTYSGLPNNVNCVQYDENSQLLAAASSSYLKIYDIRVQNCIKTLTSAGRCIGDDVAFDSSSRFPQSNGDPVINAIAMLSNNMFTSFGDKVRHWDLRNFNSFSPITSKHQSQIMCMAAKYLDNKRILVTGAKDHYIKVHDFGLDDPSNALQAPLTQTLEPPHYDGIESLALSGSTLYSGSRDCLLKKWDLNKSELQCTTNNAHTGWITGLALAPSTEEYLLSTSRDGTMKLWKAASIRELSKVDANKSGINCISVNSSAIFTGSNEGSIGFWKLRKLCDSMENTISE